ncbi:MAG TPA: exopolyphosphatase [Nocardioides sp.]|nr:exopolyphosphatase [Nocardioides sp.]
MADLPVTEPSSRASVGAVDCGTNTIKLLVGALPEVAVRESRLVRLGAGLDASGRLSDEALARAFAVVEEYAAVLASHRVERLRFCATSAVRDAANAQEFLDGVRARLGVEPEVLSGSQEAALAFTGVVRSLGQKPATPVLVVDVGGGSTELALGGPGRPPATASVDVGAVRLHERHLHADPPTRAQVAACVADIDTHLAGVVLDLARAASVVAVAGTALTAAAHVLDLPHGDLTVTDGAALDVPAVRRGVDALVAMPMARRQALPYLHSGRADVIDAGGLILARVLRRTRVRRMLVSVPDILDGIAWSLVDR